MLRGSLEIQQNLVDESSLNMGTPLRGGNVSYPRMRLIDKHYKMVSEF